MYNCYCKRNSCCNFNIHFNPRLARHRRGQLFGRWHGEKYSCYYYSDSDLDWRGFYLSHFYDGKGLQLGQILEFVKSRF